MFDVVIVGGGSAGAVLAARLSEDPARTVLLLEAGPAYPPGAELAALLDPARLADPEHDWGYTSQARGRSIPTPRRRVLGGSSAVNAGVATRARPADLAKWGQHGVDGWSYTDVLPAFKLLENTPTGDDAYHGRTGPLAVRQRTDAELTPALQHRVPRTRGSPGRRERSYSPTGGAVVLATSVVQPESRGMLRLASRDPDAAPLVDNNFLSTGRDARRMLEGVRLARAIAHNPLFAPLTAGELIPADAVPDADLAEVIAANLAIYGHPTATAPMGGPDDEWAVVDAVGAVHGLAGLRVTDASIIPDIPSTPTNLTVIMLAERIHQRAYAPRS